MSYSVPPPSYRSSEPTKNSNPNLIQEESREPLLAGSSRNGYYDQPHPAELPDDFKVSTSQSTQNFTYLTFTSMASLSLKVLRRSVTPSSAKSTPSFVSLRSIHVHTDHVTYFAYLSVSNRKRLALQLFNCHADPILGCNNFDRWNHLSIAFHHSMGTEQVSHP